MSMVHSGQEAVIPTCDGDWTEGQFEALVTLHMLKPGQVLTEDDCWAIEYTRRDADKVQNNVVDAFDEGRKYGMVSVAGRDGAAMFEELDRLRTRLAVEKALNKSRAGRLAEALSDAYRFISQPLRMDTPKAGPKTATYRVETYNDLTSKLRSAIDMATADADDTQPGMSEANAPTPPVKTGEG